MGAAGPGVLVAGGGGASDGRVSLWVSDAANAGAGVSLAGVFSVSGGAAVSLGGWFARAGGAETALEAVLS
jgi:hypothetical protein